VKNGAHSLPSQSLDVMGRRYWFRRRRFGWGLEPGSREGWIATAAFVAVDAGGVFVLMPFVVRTHPWVLVAWAAFWFVIFLTIVFLKGESLV
jgi:hypothetical protein